MVVEIKCALLHLQTGNGSRILPDAKGARILMSTPLGVNLSMFCWSLSLSNHCPLGSQKGDWPIIAAFFSAVSLQHY